MFCLAFFLLIMIVRTISTASIFCDCFDDDSSSLLLLPSMVRIEQDIFGQSWMRSSWMGNLPITYVTRMGRLKQNTPRTGWGYSDTPTSRGSVLLMEVSWSIMKSWTATRFGHINLDHLGSGCVWKLGSTTPNFFIKNISILFMIMVMNPRIFRDVAYVQPTPSDSLWHRSGF